MMFLNVAVKDVGRLLLIFQTVLLHCLRSTTESAVGSRKEYHFPMREGLNLGGTGRQKFWQLEKKIQKGMPTDRIELSIFSFAQGTSETLYH